MSPEAAIMSASADANTASSSAIKTLSFANRLPSALPVPDGTRACPAPAISRSDYALSRVD